MVTYFMTNNSQNRSIICVCCSFWRCQDKLGIKNLQGRETHGFPIKIELKTTQVRYFYNAK